MMKKILIVLFMSLNISLYSNDGAYLSHGGIIFPINENNISMEKEILSFKVRDEICYVNIQFTFNNPKNENQKLLMGFQAPGADGDVNPEDKGNGIKGFTIFYDNKIIPYKLKIAHSEDEKLYEMKDYVPENKEDTGIYVYLFEIDFKPGMNIISHSYSFPASSSVVVKEHYEYILTTGAKWAGKVIKDLTVKVDMGENQYFYMKDIFGNKAKWSVIGTGKVIDKNIKGMYDDHLKMVRILSGYLKIEVKDFTPKVNIDFGIIKGKTFDTTGFLVSNNIEIKLYDLEFYDDDKDYSKEQLRFFRNAIYAKYGYDFKDQNLKKLYSQYNWYIPNPNLDISEINMTQFDNELLRKIMEQEKLVK